MEDENDGLIAAAVGVTGCHWGRFSLTLFRDKGTVPLSNNVLNNVGRDMQIAGWLKEFEWETTFCKTYKGW